MPQTILTRTRRPADVLGNMPISDPRSNIKPLNRRKTADDMAIEKCMNCISRKTGHQTCLFKMINFANNQFERYQEFANNPESAKYALINDCPVVVGGILKTKMEAVAPHVVKTAQDGKTILSWSDDIKQRQEELRTLLRQSHGK